MIIYPVPGRILINNVELKKSDGGFAISVMDNVDIQAKHGTQIHIDESILLNYVDSLPSYVIDHIFDRLGPETLQKLADKVYKAKFEDIVNK